MAKKSIVEKWKRTPKFKVRGYNRCHRCGRPRAFLRDFGMCRICFRELALSGQIPGRRQVELVGLAVPTRILLVGLEAWRPRPRWRSGP